MHLKAYAKINLGLRVLDKRPDGYHNIETIIQPVDFFDELEIVRRNSGIEFVSDTPPYGEDNLCFKAAKLFLDSAGSKTGISINLKKHIWQGAGLGGGSSCAAQTLIGMNRELDLPMDMEKLLKLALNLGSDVPFFMEHSPAFVKGRGEVIERLTPLKTPLFVVLVNPGFEISTKWAYEKLHEKRLEKKLTKEKSNINMAKIDFLKGNIKGLVKELQNDFEEIVFEAYPRLKCIKERLISAGALIALMSGTGSCLYGIFDAVDDKLRNLFSNYSVILTKVI